MAGSSIRRTFSCVAALVFLGAVIDGPVSALPAKVSRVVVCIEKQTIRIVSSNSKCAGSRVVWSMSSPTPALCWRSLSPKSRVGVRSVVLMPSGKCPSGFGRVKPTRGARALLCADGATGVLRYPVTGRCSANNRAVVVRFGSAEPMTTKVATGPILVGQSPNCGELVSLTWSGAQPETGWYSVQWVPTGSTFDEFTMFNVRGTSTTLPDWFAVGVTYRFRVFAMNADWDGATHTDQHVTPSSNVVELTIPQCPAASTDTSVASYSWQQQGADIDGFAAFDVFGYAVASSDDGSVVAVGAPENDGNGPNAGNVQVFAWDGTAWVQRGINLNAEAFNDSFGISVALSDDGSILAVGAPYNDGAGVDAGHVRVFVWDGTSWSQRGGDIDGEVAGDESGSSVALSADGTIVAIGATKNVSNTGHVRAYSWNGSAWVQRGRDIDGESSGDLFGYAVALSDDGTVLAVGGPDNAGTGLIAGHVRVFAWDGTSWSQRGSDIDGGAAGDRSGWSVALSADGTIVVVGALTGADGGYVRVFVWSGSAWVQRGSDIDAEVRTDSGQSIALSDDGTILAIGTNTNDNDNGVDAGHVRVFAWSGSAWVQRGSDIDGEGVSTNSGWSVALSDDGSILAIGGILNSNANGASGHVRVYFWR